MSDSSFGVDGWASITSTSVVVFANLVVFCAKLGWYTGCFWASSEIPFENSGFDVAIGSIAVS